MLQQISIDRPMSAIPLTTGVTLSYLEQGDQEGEAMTLLHGYTDSSHSYALVLPLLSQRYHTFAIDQRGHGNSSKPEHGYDMNDFVADVIALMDAKGIDKATIVGHSMGATIAELIAIQHPQRVSRLVLIGAMTVIGNEALTEFDSVVQTLVDPIAPAFVQEYQISTLFWGVAAEFFEQVMAESLRVPAHVWRQVSASFVQHSTTVDLTRIRAPTLMLWGDQDQFASRSDQEMLYRLVPNAIVHRYEQTGHALHWEQPQQFVADLNIFCKKRNQNSTRARAIAADHSV